MAWLIIAAYLAVGLVTARMVYTREHVGNGDLVGLLAFFAGLLWPLVPPTVWVMRFVTGGVRLRRERVEQLRADREAWRVKTYSHDRAEQKMAGEVVKVLDAALDDLRRFW
jgi:hypothetical protein